MRKIRKNNDILVDVSVKRDGYPEDLEGKDVLLSMKVAYINIPVKDFTVNGNVISFTYPASAQKHVGVYSLTIQVKSEGATNTVDKCDIFELVGCSCQISGEDDPNIKTESVSLGLDVYLDAGGSGTGGGGEGTSDYNRLENKPKINGVTLVGNKTLEQLGVQPQGDYLTKNDLPALKGDKGDKGEKGDDGKDGTNGTDGKSAYQIWLDNGNTGTESDYLASLKGEKGEEGIQGVAGQDGADGYTPIKGVDYFTDADKQEMENAVTESLEKLIPPTDADLSDTSVNPVQNKVITAALGTKQPVGNYTTAGQLATALSGYVEKVIGKGLSTNDFTNVLKQKLEGLSNYNDTAVQNAIISINNRMDTLLGGSASTAIDTFHEIESFLQGITDTQTLTGLLNDLREEIVALIPTKTSQLANDSGFLTEHQDISNLATVKELADGLAEKQPKGDYALASDIPSLAGYATEQWVTSQINNAIDGLSTEIVSINDLVGTDTEGGIA